jgi:L-iditol 2-dehydrogenase
VVEIIERPVPELDPRDILARVELAGICGTDVHLVFDAELTAGKPPAYPFNLGHEAVCRIVALGREAPRRDALGVSLQEGDRIVAFGPRCGECYFCRVLEQSVLCRRVLRGRRDPGAHEIGGTYADSLYVRGDAFIVRIPDAVSTQAAALAEPLAGAARAIERACMPGVPDHHQGLGPGKSVLVQGAGPIGVLLTILARSAGAATVIVIGAPESRLALCREFGADLTLNFRETSEEERAERVRALTPFGVGPDIVLEAAGTPAAFVEAMRLVRAGGTIVEHGHFTYRGTLPIDLTPIVLKDLQIFGNLGYYNSGFVTAVRILESQGRRVALERVVTHEFPLSRVHEALEAVRREECVKAVLAPGLG